MVLFSESIGLRYSNGLDNAMDKRIAQLWNAGLDRIEIADKLGIADDIVADSLHRQDLDYDPEIAEGYETSADWDYFQSEW